MAENNGSHLSIAQQAELQRRFPRMSWWLGMAPSHPNFPRPASSHWDQYAASSYHVNQTVQNQSQLVGQPPHYNSIGPAPPHYNSIEPAPPPYIPPVNISISVPLNSGVVGAVVSRATLRLPLDIPFQDFYTRVCMRMDLDPLEAALGYKFHCDRVRDAPPHIEAALTKMIRNFMWEDDSSPRIVLELLQKPTEEGGDAPQPRQHAIKRV